MEVRPTYKFRRNDDVIGYHCGDMPTGVEILETYDILYPQEGYDLQRISDGEILGSIWLKDGDTEDNYIEIVHIDTEA